MELIKGTTSNVRDVLHNAKCSCGGRFNHEWEFDDDDSILYSRCRKCPKMFYSEISTMYIFDESNKDE